MDEFDLIETYFSPLAGKGAFALTDDAACISPSQGCELVVTKDTMVEGVHFPKGEYGAAISGRLLRVNLSDIAAKGARPVAYLLSCAFPEHIMPSHIQDFAHGLADMQKIYKLTLLGGDTVKTSGPMVVTITCFGEVPCGTMMRRKGAQIADDIWLSGTIGDALLGLEIVKGDYAPALEHFTYLKERYYAPSPRVGLGQALRGLANACLDISDGLLADAGHLAKASHVGFELDIEALTLSQAARLWLEGQGEKALARLRLMTFGDDYELLFTAPPERSKDIEALGKSLSVPLQRIGVCVTGESVKIYGEDRRIIPVKTRGYRHF